MDKSRKEKWIRQKASGLLNGYKKDENTAEHLIIYKLTSGSIYTDELYYTNIDRLGSRGGAWSGRRRRSKERKDTTIFFYLFHHKDIFTYTNIIIIILHEMDSSPYHDAEIKDETHEEEEERSSVQHGPRGHYN